MNLSYIIQQEEYWHRRLADQWRDYRRARAHDRQYHRGLTHPCGGMMMTTSLTVRVDYENNAEQWWDAMRSELPRLATQDPELYELLSKLSGDEDSVEITDPATIQRFCTFAESLPGWDEGPEYARNPLLLLYGDED